MHTQDTNHTQAEKSPEGRTFPHLESKSDASLNDEVAMSTATLKLTIALEERSARRTSGRGAAIHNSVTDIQPAAG